MDSPYKIDINSPVPIYVQIREIIREEILSGEHKGKEYAITALAERFDVNRLTVRQAINELIREGLMYSVKGVGTFASPPKPIIENIDKPINFFSQPSTDGNSTNIEVRKMVWVPATPPVSEALKIPLGTQVLFIDRIRYFDDVPFAIEHRYIRGPWANVLTVEKIKNNILRHILTIEMAVKWSGLENEISSMLATWQEAKVLKIDKNSPLLVRRFVMYDENNQAIVHGSSFYRADRYRWKNYVNLKD